MLLATECSLLLCGFRNYSGESSLSLMSASCLFMLGPNLVDVFLVELLTYEMFTFSFVNSNLGEGGLPL